jgi:hypothetical protein
LFVGSTDSFETNVHSLLRDACNRAHNARIVCAAVLEPVHQPLHVCSLDRRELFAQPLLRQSLSAFSTVRAQQPSCQAPKLPADLFVLAAALLYLQPRAASPKVQRGCTAEGSRSRAPG